MTAKPDRLASLSPARRALLEQLLAQRTRAADVPADPDLQPAVSTPPLSPAQERMWVLQQLSPGSAAYNMKSATTLGSAVELAGLQWACDRIVERHAILRATFPAREDGTPTCALDEHARVTVGDVHCDDLRRAKALADADAGRAFALGVGPLMRVTRYRAGAGEQLLGVVLHHIVADGWSMGLLIDEFAQHFRAWTAGTPQALEPSPQYADFVAWQSRRLTGQHLDELVGYWAGALAEASLELHLPTDRPRPLVPTQRGGAVAVHWTPHLNAGLRQLAAAHDCTLFMVLLAALGSVLGRYSGQDDVVIGVPVSGRYRPDQERMIGLFLNSLPLRIDLSGNPSVADLLSRTRSVALAGYSHQELPFERIVDAVDPPRDLGRNPIFQVQLALNNTPPPSRALAEFGGEVPLDNTGAKFDLNLAVAEDGSELRGSLEYATELFDAETAARLVVHLTQTLGGMVEHPDAGIGELDLLTAHEQDAINARAAGPHLAVGGACLPDLIHHRAAGVPDRIAVVQDGRQLSYRQLATCANRLAHALRQRGVGPERVVGVCMPRSLEMVVAVVGVLTAGGAYLPMDPEHPRARLSAMVADAGCPVVLVTPETATVLDPEATAAQIVLIDDAARVAPEHPATRPAAGLSQDNIAYVIYTSGSTGTPKGVLMTHRGIVNRLAGMRSRVGIDADDTVLHKTPFTFDVSVWELFLPLTLGARLVLAAPGAQRDPARLRATIEERGVTTCHFVPSMLTAYLETEPVPACVRRVICSGEELGTGTAATFLERASADLYNLYGPTEAAIDVTEQHVREVAPGALRVPIGTPAANTSIQLLDGRLQAVPDNVSAELCIGGPQVARGYLGRGGLTAERFVPDPWGGGGRVYRTGDRARRRADGAVEFLGRWDRQVKLRGHRVELGEVEAALLADAGVAQAVVVVAGVSGLDELVGYVVVSQPGAAGGLRERLGLRLPGFMVPSRVVVLARLPLSANGKVDRGALPVAGGGEPGVAHVAPSSPVEQVLAGIWAEVLGVSRVGVRDNFFAIGGDSIKAIRAVALARRQGIAVSVGDVFQAPTVEALAGRCQDQQDQPEHDGLLLSEQDRAVLDSLNDPKGPQ